MNDDLKFIINEVNQVLKTNFNLMSFDSIFHDNILQIVLDILHCYEVIEKIDVKLLGHECSQKKMIEVLKKIHCRIQNVNSSTSINQYSTKLEKSVFYSILKYIFENKDKIKNITYLAQFLSPIKITDEAISNTEIAYVWKTYLNQIGKFKAVHKGYVESSTEKIYIKEIRNDINAIEIEKNRVVERIGRIQFRLDKLFHRDIVEKAQVLRKEKNREKEIFSHIKDQNIETHRAKMAQNHLKKELSNNQIVYAELSTANILSVMEEEVDVIKFLAKQKLPKEYKILQKKYNKLENMKNVNLSREYNNTLRNKIEEKSKQIQLFFDVIPAENSNYENAQKLIVFRQQVATVIKKKETAAESLNRISKEVIHIKNILLKKQNQIENVFGDLILRGDELKTYVNKLKSKNLTYKQNRAELSSLRAEIMDLISMLDALKSQEPKLPIVLKQNNITELLPNSNTSINGKGLTEILRITEALKRSINANRNRLAPLTQNLKPLRERTVQLKDEKNSQKQFYNSIDVTLQTEMALFQSKIQEKEAFIFELEHAYKKLQVEYKRAEVLLKRVTETSNTNSNGKFELKEDIAKQIFEKQLFFKHLEEQAHFLNDSETCYRKQQEIWSSIKLTLKIKLSCLTETDIKEKNGILSVQQNIETFILN